MGTQMTPDEADEQRQVALAEELEQLAQKYDVTLLSLIVTPNSSSYFRWIPKWANVVDGEQDFSINARCIMDDQDAENMLHTLASLRSMAAQIFNTFDQLLSQAKALARVARGQPVERTSKAKEVN